MLPTNEFEWTRVTECVNGETGQENGIGIRAARCPLYKECFGS